ncbi:MAG: sugar ABC transporter substrate-binding protein [Firmicutes bacterium]|nr:sugar ABC transporter substrate-binding protein [Bacillota bacterium]
MGTRNILRALALIVVAILGTTALASAEPVVLQFWDMQWGDAAVNEMRAIVDDWNAANPDIQVEYDFMGWGNYREKLLAAVQAGTAPDITSGDSGMPFLFEAMGQTLPLNDLIETWREDGRLADMNPWAYEKFHWEDEYIGITWQIDARGIFYRKDIFEEKGIPVPTNWDELLEAAKALNDPENEFYGIAFPGKAGTYDTDQFFMTLAYQAGANPVDEQGRLTLNTPEFLEALKFEQELLKYAPPGTAGYAFDELSRLYQQGKVAMVFHGGWFIDQTRKAAPEIFEVTGLLPVLAGPTGIQRSIGFFNGWMIFKQSKHPEEAKKFLDHLMKPETLGRLYEAHLGGFWPIYGSLTDLEAYQSDELFQEFARQVAEYSVDYYYPTNIGAAGLSAWGTGLADFVINPMLAGTVTPEQALANGQRRLEGLFRRQ